MQVVLRVENNKSNVRQLRLKSASTTIGRGAECQLKVASDQVSRRHCQILVHDNWVAIVDLGSSNGTFVNSRQIPPHVEIPLTPGTKVGIGGLLFSVEYDLAELTIDETLASFLNGSASPSQDEVFDGESTQPMRAVKSKLEQAAAKAGQSSKVAREEAVTQLEIPMLPPVAAEGQRDENTLPPVPVATHMATAPVIHSNVELEFSFQSLTNLATDSSATATTEAQAPAAHSDQSQEAPVVPGETTFEAAPSSAIPESTDAPSEAITGTIAGAIDGPTSDTTEGVTSDAGAVDPLDPVVPSQTPTEPGVADDVESSEADGQLADESCDAEFEVADANEEQDDADAPLMEELDFGEIPVAGRVPTAQVVPVTEAFHEVDEQQFNEMLSQLESAANVAESADDEFDLESASLEVLEELGLNQSAESGRDQTSTTLENDDQNSISLLPLVAATDATEIIPTLATTAVSEIAESASNSTVSSEALDAEIRDPFARNVGTNLSNSATLPLFKGLKEHLELNESAASTAPSLAPYEVRSVRPKLVQVLNADKTQSAAMPVSNKKPLSPVAVPNVQTGAKGTDARPLGTRLDRGTERPVRRERSAAIPKLGHLLGVDHTPDRTGFAICNSDQTIASLIESDKQQETVDAKRIERLLTDHNIVGLVVSLPVAKRGVESPKAADCRKFAEWLVQVTKLPISFADERSSSRFAAQVMLQGYLDLRRAEVATPRVLAEK